MMRKLTLLTVAIMGMCAMVKAQYCGFDQVHNGLLNSSPAYAQRVQAMNSQLAALLTSNPNALVTNGPNGPFYDIPVVIHVMATGGTQGTIYNPSDATLLAMITYLNQSYQATYSGYPNASSGGTYFPVQFSLAKRDPNCNAALTGNTGIIHESTSTLLMNRYGSTLGSAIYSRYVSDGVRQYNSAATALGVREDSIKVLDAWDHNDYYNIWVVNKIQGQDGTVGTFTAGFAYFPGAGPNLDGTILLATQAVAGQITLPHEIGHAFSLYHTFQGDDPGNTGAATTCPPNTNCLTDGDMVCDTEPMKRSTFNCPSGINPCTGAAWQNTQRNFMDYSNCQDRFTAGQKTRWLNALTTSRSSLLSSLGGTTLGTAPAAYICAPTLPFPFAATVDDGVYETKLNDMDAVSDGGYVADGGREYIDRACLQRANLTAGSTYTLSVLTGPRRNFVRVYMDYNNDGFFAAGELIFSDNGAAGTAGQYQVHSATFTVPTTGFTACVPIRMRVVADYNNGSTSVAPGPCTQLVDGQAEDYSVVIKAAAPSAITINQTTGTNPSCIGTSLGFTASYTGSPTSPSVRIYVNGTQVTTGTTYSSSALNNGDVVTARLFYIGTCGADSVASAGFTVSRNTNTTPTVSIAVDLGNNPGCSGQYIRFRATPTNGGTAPTYVWKVNGITQTGYTTDTFSSTSLPCNSSVTAVLTSNSACATTTMATSNAITYTCGAQGIGVSIAVTGGSNPTCSGRSVTFSATPVNGGTAPVYQWYVNGTAVTGATGASFSTNTLNNGDSVTVVLTSNYSCAATSNATSRAIYETVIPSVTPTVTKSITRGSNPGCRDSLIQFTANPANAGATPTYRWYLNGALVATGAVYNNFTAVTGDRVWLRLAASNAASSCYTSDTAMSDTTTLTRLPTPTSPYISFIGHQLVSDSGNVQWYGPAGLIPGATGNTFYVTVEGDYYAAAINPLCGTGKSNVLTVSPLSVAGYNMTGVKLYPNPTTGLVTITWSAAATTRIVVYTPAGKVVMQDVATLATRKVVDLSALPSGTYFLTLQGEDGRTGSVRMTVAH